jgi:hypothetical protein
VVEYRKSALFFSPHECSAQEVSCSSLGVFKGVSWAPRSAGVLFRKQPTRIARATTAGAWQINGRAQTPDVDVVVVGAQCGRGRTTGVVGTVKRSNRLFITSHFVAVVMEGWIRHVGASTTGILSAQGPLPRPGALWGNRKCGK